MAKNYMQDVARMLGVELEEEFEILNSGYIYKIDEDDGLMHRRLSDNFWHNSSAHDFENLLTGKKEIIKLPWQPRYDEKYYRPGLKFTKVLSEIWNNTVADFAYKETGMVFRTKEECEAALPELRKKYLGGENNG